MTTSPLHYQTITELAALIRKGDITAVELAEHFISRINRLESRPLACYTVCRKGSNRCQRYADRRRCQDFRKACGR
jgi:Asp-tRNA(Asn)/Glu-tRNA(Gln) amidotransferase A subunit family amidase